jgi:ATP-binding protein involved in chromosome partitioning
MASGGAGAVTERQVLEALKGVIEPESGRDIVSLGMVPTVTVRDGNVRFAIEVDPKKGATLEPLRQSAERAVSQLAGVLSVSAVLTAERPASVNAAPPKKQARPDHGHDHAHDHGHDHPKGPAPAQRPPRQGKLVIPNVRAIVAVASGKGGVGKSTTAANLALALMRLGLKVGVLDADIYGPSMPRMLGIKGQPNSDGKALEPMQRHGIKCMSMGFLVPEETPMIWRGPMVMSAIQQMLRDVAWGELDILVVDLPPGTGDAQLTMAQQVPLAGAVIVSTPQDIALLDARKGLNMFRQVDVPVFGIVENMSYFLCPQCGARSEIFSHGGARREAAKLGVEFLAEIPLDIAIRETSDGGEPIVVSQPESGHAQAYLKLAERVWAKAQESVAAGEKRAPKIVVE